MPPLDEEALRSDIRLIEASHAGKEHAFSAGFHEGYGSAYHPEIGNIDLWRRGFVYIVTSAREGILFVKVTSDLPRRLFEHRTTRMPGVTVYQGVETLVWFEVYDQLIDAVERQKAIKKMPRQKKIDLVESINPDWADLSHRLLSS
ncbi:GIY-YIG nuclease family protein [Shinella sp.]|uniref:GIY-YIG nuclease family protein n=1 Tax=Shinella sp. TaxID=1870904 RepID=UPI0028A92FA8|nr:GIY-YIG nuclease family protein [Shinella sp.]